MPFKLNRLQLKSSVQQVFCESLHEVEFAESQIQILQHLKIAKLSTIPF